MSNAKKTKHYPDCDKNYCPWYPFYNFVGPTGPTGNTGSVLNSAVDVPNIDSVILSIDINKRIDGLTGNVDGGATASGTGAWVEGGGNIASGAYSHAEGLGTQALNIADHSEGISTIALGIGSHAEGIATRAMGIGSHAEGGGTHASGNYSHAEGDPTIASGYASHAEGINTIASGQGSHAEGEETRASGNDSHSEGGATHAIGDMSHAEGGRGIALGIASHVEGFLCGSLEFCCHAEGAGTTASGPASHAEGGQTIALGLVSHAEGAITTASGTGSHAEGWGCTASGYGSHAEGEYTEASGHGSHAEGTYTVASGFGSHAEGSNTFAFGAYSHTEGINTIANNIGIHIIGVNGSSRVDDYSWQLSGGITGSTTPGDGISAIIRTTTFGTPQPQGQMITDQFSIGSADYAEYFEWEDGNPNSEDRVGYFVQLDGEKISFAADTESVIGIVSGNPGVVGDTAELGWQGTNITDEFGRLMTKDNYEVSMKPILRKYGAKYLSSSTDKEIIISDIIAENASDYKNSIDLYISNNIKIQQNLPDRCNVENYRADKISLDNCRKNNIIGKYIDKYSNSDKLLEFIMNKLSEELMNTEPISSTITSDLYDSSKYYIPRSKRKEWSSIGLLGKLYVRDNGECKVGEKCDCENGIAIPGNKWKIIKRSAYNVIRILYK